MEKSACRQDLPLRRKKPARLKLSAPSNFLSGVGEDKGALAWEIACSHIHDSITWEPAQSAHRNPLASLAAFSSRMHYKSPYLQVLRAARRGNLPD
jgi:hypothetical protein